MKKKKRKKRLIVQIDVIELEVGQYYIDTTQLSNLIIPLTEFEKNSPPTKNPIAKNELKQAIEDAKKYTQQLAHILHYDVTIKVKKS
jgi:hypothetical protein